MNPTEQYYVNQAGSGLAANSGYGYQRGDGFFGRFLGKNALSAGINVASDVVNSDDYSLNNIKAIGKTRLKGQAKSMAKDLVAKMSNYQSGSGIKKKPRKFLSKKRKPIKGAKKARKGKRAKTTKKGKKHRKSKKKSVNKVAKHFLS